MLTTTGIPAINDAYADKINSGKKSSRNLAIPAGGFYELYASSTNPVILGESDSNLPPFYTAPYLINSNPAAIIPSDAIFAFAGSSVPSEWRNLSETNTNLAGRVLIGNNTLGEKGGYEYTPGFAATTNTATETIPAPNLTLAATSTGFLAYSDSSDLSSLRRISGEAADSNMPPYLVLNYISFPDTTLPSSKILYPQKNAKLKKANRIIGKATDNVEVDYTRISIQDTSTGKYYTGTGFTADTETWITTSKIGNN